MVGNKKRKSLWAHDHKIAYRKSLCLDILKDEENLQEVEKNI
jgi:hypothetical protein